MEEEGSTESVATSKSLLNWVSAFSFGGPCSLLLVSIRVCLSTHSSTLSTFSRKRLPSWKSSRLGSFFSSAWSPCKSNVMSVLLNYFNFCLLNPPEFPKQLVLGTTVPPQPLIPKHGVKFGGRWKVCLKVYWISGVAERKEALGCWSYKAIDWCAVDFHSLEFCGCSLDKSVSRQEVLSGNQEHIARVSYTHTHICCEAVTVSARTQCHTSLPTTHNHWPTPSPRKEPLCLYLLVSCYPDWWQLLPYHWSTRSLLS